MKSVKHENIVNKLPNMCKLWPKQTSETILKKDRIPLKDQIK